MQKFKKKFPFINLLPHFKRNELKARTQLFLVSLIALFYERERRKGGYVFFSPLESSPLEYKIKVRDKEITKKFKFKVDTIWRIRDDIELKKLPIEIECKNVFKRGVKYPYEKRFKKQFDHEFFYRFCMGKGDFIKIPTSIIYAKDLTTKEKLAILWNISLEDRDGRLPRLKEIEKESGISEKTIRKAMKKYPQL